MGILRNEPSDLNELSVESTPSFRILDELTFESEFRRVTRWTTLTLHEVLHNFNLPPSEEVTSIGSFPLSCSGEVSQYFVIGSEITAPVHNTPYRGRIHVYRMVSVHAVDDITSILVKGSVGDLNCVDSKIVACVDSAVSSIFAVFSPCAHCPNTYLFQVIVYELVQTESDLRPTLVSLATWDRGYHLHTVRVRGEVIVTADALRSLDVLVWNGKSLSLRARDHSSLWPIAMETVDGENIMVAEASPIL